MQGNDTDLSDFPQNCFCCKLESVKASTREAIILTIKMKI
jgi:hypothetical protein